MIQINILILLCLTSFHLFAVENVYSGKTAMNHIEFEKYKNFSQEWTLVTIRFRKDTSEMRLTYANKLALETLLKGSINYPNGAVFAKTGILTGEDTQFPSSIVPRAVRRYQIMVKDNKAYNATGGWGYALFDADGKTYPEEPLSTQQACYACHTIVENRGYVFSEIFDYSAKTKFAVRAGSPKTSIKFQTIDKKKLSSKVSKILPENFKQVRFLSNEIIRKYVFQGTLDELKPVLEKEAIDSNMPSIFISLDQEKFVVALPVKKAECLNLTGIKIVSTDLSGSLKTIEVCLND